VVGNKKHKLVGAPSCPVETQVGVVILDSFWSVLGWCDDHVARMAVESFSSYLFVIRSAFPPLLKKKNLRKMEAVTREGIPFERGSPAQAV
jgi:hypothetical protein